MQARLRAQLGDRSKYSGERRRRSVVVASIVLTITDPLRGSYPFWYYLQAALIRSCGASFACMELTIISRFQRLQASTSNHKPKGRFFWFAFGIYKPKVTMFAVEMWFGVGDGVECGRSTGLCPLPLGVPRCVIHNKKNVGTKFLVILKKNKY